jgi:hypothetical protein
MAGNTIFGASDRMITVGDMTVYEPPTPKLLALTSSIVAMTAGDMGLQTEILREVHRVVHERITSKPDEWLKVKDVVELYMRLYSEAKLLRSENAILAPLGLDRSTYLTQNTALAKDLASELIAYQIPGGGVQTIFAGIDTYGGAHIYVTDGTDILCCDSSGYAAIGTGSTHASSHFMLSRHSWDAPIPETLLRVYIAKKRAETAPGVGKDTDVFMVGPNLGQSTTIRPEVVGHLDKIYNKLKSEEAKILKTADKEVQAYVDKLDKEARTQAETVNARTAEAPAPPQIDVNRDEGRKAGS